MLSDFRRLFLKNFLEEHPESTELDDTKRDLETYRIAMWDMEPSGWNQGWNSKGQAKKPEATGS